MVDTQVASTRSSRRRWAALAAASVVASVIGTIAWTSTAIASNVWVIEATVSASAPYSVTVSGVVPASCSDGDASLAVTLGETTLPATIDPSGGDFEVTFEGLSEPGPHPVTVAVVVGTPSQSCPAPPQVVAVGPLEWTDELIDPEVTVSTSYTDAVAAEGNGAVTYSVIEGALPAGITLSSTGALSGTPTATGLSTFTIQAEDAAGLTITAPLSISVVPAVVTTSLAWTETALPGGTVGAGYEDSVSAEGTGTIAYALAGGTLPPGLVLDPASGSVTGTPTTAGTYTFTLQATNGTDTITTTPTVVIGEVVVEPDPVVVNPTQPTPAPAPAPAPVPAPAPAPVPAAPAAPAPVVDSVSTPNPVPAPAAKPSAVTRQLARTGTTTVPMTLFGLGLVLLGAAAAAAGRRRDLREARARI